MKGLFYLRYALRSLIRSGQRTLLAMLCVAFGVMSLVSLQLLATMVRDAVIVDPRVVQGGDALVWPTGNWLSEPRDNDLDALRSDGIINNYTLYSESNGLLLKSNSSASTPIYFLNRAQGVDPETYPLIGAIELRDGKSLSSTIAQAGDVVISRDLVDKVGLKQGNTFTLGSYSGDTPIRLRVAGIAEHMPDNNGDTVIYSLETAAKFAGQTNIINYGAVLFGAKGAPLSNVRCTDANTLPGFEDTTAERVFCGGNWSFQAASSFVDGRIVDVFDLMLRGAGLLGLLVGGIGVANTLQVLLARRTLEIATLKTLGYNRRDVMMLIGVETALLGIVGSIAGALAAIALSYPFMTLFAATGSLLMDWHIDGFAVAGGMLAGAGTAIIFGLVASVRASAVRPASLLRNHAEAQPRSSRAAVLGLWVLLALLFGTISSLILSSALWGAGVVGVAVAGFVVLGGVLGGALAALVRVPLPGRSIWSLAQHNLKRQSVRAIFALIALFAGTFSIGFATSTILSAQARVASRAPEQAGDNLVVYGRATEATLMKEQLDVQGITPTRSNLLVSVDVYSDSGALLPIQQLEGLDNPALDPDIQNMTGAAWGTQQGVYLDITLSTEDLGGTDPLKLGDNITLKTPGGEQTLPVIGFFERPNTNDRQNNLFTPKPSIVVPADLARQVGGDATTAMFVAQAEIAQLPTISATLSQALPGALVFTSTDVTNTLLRSLLSLFSFVVAIAGLALVAGAILIANAVGLALVERRKELGILKAVGYSSRQILRTLLIEHSLLGLLGGVAGVCATFAAIALINQDQPSAKLTLEPLPTVLIVGMSVLLSLASTILVARRPTSMRPAEVLRED